MTYEIIGKLAITIGILITIPIFIWIIGYILDWLTDQIQKLPDVVRAIIGFGLLGLFILGLGVLIFFSL